MAKKNKKREYNFKEHKSKVIKAFKKNDKDGVLVEYKVGDTFATRHQFTIEQLKKIKYIE